MHGFEDERDPGRIPGERGPGHKVASAT
jgi:hypothetical protein